MWLSAVILALAPLTQSVHWQRSQASRARRFLDAQRTTMATLYAAENDFEESLHQRKLALTRELHLSEMVHDIGIAQREAVRDDWQQHSLYLQSVMMMASLIFSLATAIFCEAGIPLDSSASSNSYAIVALFFALLCGVGVSSSLGCLWLCLKVQARMAEFDFHAPTALYSCGKPHFEFSDYHTCHCQQVEWASFLMFLMSVVSTVAAGCLEFAASMFDLSSAGPAGAATAFALCSVVAVSMGAVHSFVQHRQS